MTEWLIIGGPCDGEWRETKNDERVWHYEWHSAAVSCMTDDGDECAICAGLGVVAGCFEDCCSGDDCDPEDAENCCAPRPCDCRIAPAAPESTSNGVSGE